MDWGPRIKTLEAEEKSSGIPNPRLTNRPRLRADTRFYWSLYGEIADTRTTTAAGIQPLSTTEITSFSDLHGIPRGEPAIKFFRVIRALDNAFLDWVEKKAEQNRRQTKT